VWENPISTKQTRCDGKVLRITDNLHDLLWQIRKTFRETDDSGSEAISLWADAICVNRADMKEKTAQVCMMHEIYKAASSVICWLGKEQDNDHTAFLLMRQIYAVLGEQDTDFERSEMEARLPLMGLPDLNLSIWLTLAGIYERPWSSMVWVIQEFLMAKRPELWCGKHIISHECLLNAASISMAFGGPVILQLRHT
jgi:hypothetical protein